MPDRSVALEVRSPLDGSTQRATLRLPEAETAPPLPLIVAPNPFGWSVEEDYSGGCIGLRAPSHAGWRGVPSEQAVAVLQLDGHHEHEAHCSIGGPGTAADLPAWLDRAAEVQAIDPARIYACGLSVGGQESLLMCAAHPERFAACFVFNPVVDPAAWHDDLAAHAPAALREEHLDEIIAREVGGRPDEVPGAYRERDPLARPEALTRTPLAIWWSPLDNVVPRQETHHGKRLHDVLKALDASAPVTEHDHTALHVVGPDPDVDTRWGLHEWSDYALAARWLLTHSR